MKERLKQFAQSGYKDLVVEWFDEQITHLTQPEQLPSDNLEDVKAHKKTLTKLKEYRDFWANLSQEQQEQFGEYE